MDAIIKYLDKSLDYVSHELKEDTLYITVRSNLESVPCPDCLMNSTKSTVVIKRAFKTSQYKGKKLSLL